MRKADKALSSKWEATLRHEGLSMHRGSNISKRKKLTYVDPSDLDALPDVTSNPEDILLAKEKVKTCPFTSVWVSHSHLRNGVYEACND